MTQQMKASLHSKPHWIPPTACQFGGEGFHPQALINKLYRHGINSERNLKFCWTKLWYHDAKLHRCWRAGTQIPFWMTLFHVSDPLSTVPGPQANVHKVVAAVMRVIFIYGIKMLRSPFIAPSWAFPLNTQLVGQMLFPVRGTLWPFPRMVEPTQRNLTLCTDPTEHPASFPTGCEKSPWWLSMGLWSTNRWQWKGMCSAYSFRFHPSVSFWPAGVHSVPGSHTPLSGTLCTDYFGI